MFISVDHSFVKSGFWLIISDPPRHPEIDGYREGEIVQVGDHLTLSCISRGGKPRAALAWLRNGEPVEGIFTGVGRDSSSTLSFTVQDTDNNAVYSCSASNPLTPRPLVAAIKLTVICKYQILYQINTSRPKSGCTSNSNN